MDTKPFENFGQLLKNLRRQKRMTLKILARALGTDHSYISKLESGLQRPSKSLLNQIINVFELNNQQAFDIFKLVGYKRGVISSMQEDQEQHKTELLIRPDQLTLYSDAVRVEANPYGFVLSFAQTLGPNQQIVVSRIGMSKEHIKSFIKVLQGLIEKAEGNLETRKISVN